MWKGPISSVCVQQNKNNRIGKVLQSDFVRLGNNLKTLLVGMCRHTRQCTKSFVQYSVMKRTVRLALNPQHSLHNIIGSGLSNVFVFSLVSSQQWKMRFLCNIIINCRPDWYKVEKYYCGDQGQGNTLENNASSPLLESEILNVVHEWLLLCHYWVTDVAALLGISEKSSVDRTPIFSLPLSCSVFITSFVPTAPSPCLQSGISPDNWIFIKKMDMRGCVWEGWGGGWSHRLWKEEIKDVKITAWLPQEIPGAYSWRAGRRVVCGKWKEKQKRQFFTSWWELSVFMLCPYL